MGSRGGKDFDGIQHTANARVLRGLKEDKRPITLEEQIEHQRKEQEKELEKKEEAKRKAQIIKETPRFSNYRVPQPILEKPEKPEKVKVIKEKKEKTPKAVASQEVTKDIQLIKVEYGIDSNKIDITDRAKPGMQINNKLAGTDPAKGKKKKLYVTAIVDGVNIETIIPEGKFINF